MVENQSHLSEEAAVFLQSIDNAIYDSRFRRYHGPNSQISSPDPDLARKLDPVSEQIEDRIRSIGKLMINPISRNLSPEVLPSLATYLSQVVAIFVSSESGIHQGYRLTGFTNTVGARNYIGFSLLKDQGRELTDYEIASTFFHELTHLAEFHNFPLDRNEYRDVYQQYAPSSKRKSL